MNTKLKLSLIALIGVALIMLVLTLLQGPGQNVPTAGTPTTPGVSNGTPSSPPATTPTAPVVAAGATAQPTPIAAAATPVPAPTMTQEERKVMEYVKGLNPESQASSRDQCPTILQTQPWCSIVRSAKRITRPEWEELFPQTQFFVVEYALIGRETGQLGHVLVAEQNGQHYSAETFDRLLKANQIAITDKNRELVAKALVLMKLTDYLEADIVFSDWGTTDQPAPFDLRYNYTLTAWTKIQGLRFQWLFLFHEGSLITAGGGILEQNVGDYIDVPLDVLPLPTLSTLEYWSK